MSFAIKFDLVVLCKPNDISNIDPPENFRNFFPLCIFQIEVHKNFREKFCRQNFLGIFDFTLFNLINPIMKRNNQQSQSRAINRGHIRFTELPFVKNTDGSNVIIRERKSSRGRWIRA